MSENETCAKPDPECEDCWGTGSVFIEEGPDTAGLRGYVPCNCRAVANALNALAEEGTP